MGLTMLQELRVTREQYDWLLANYPAWVNLHWFNLHKTWHEGVAAIYYKPGTRDAEQAHQLMSYLTKYKEPTR